METVEGLIAEARRPFTDLDVTTNPAATKAFIRRLADALEASVAERDSLTATVERVRAVVQDALANADDSGNGWDAEVSASALLDILDSAPPVTRALPGREQLARTIFDAWQGKGFDAEFEYQKPEWLEVADAVLVAIEKGGE